MHVMSWIPPYAIEGSIESLESFKEWTTPSPLTVINRIGLQFWLPTRDGQAQLVHNYGAAPSPEDVRRAVKFCRQHQIAPLLCIYNYDGVDWNWELATKAFSNHRQNFIDSLLEQMQLYDLEGIDIDFEGPSGCSADQTSFQKFILELSQELKARKKLLSVNIFHNPQRHAPNISWVSDWKEEVDSVQIVGYQELYGGAEPPYNYRSQVEMAFCQEKLPFGKFLIGLPSWLSEWGRGGLGNSPQAHLQEIIELNYPVGICLWDSQLIGEPWRRAETWELIHQIKGNGAKPPSKSCCSS